MKLLRQIFVSLVVLTVGTIVGVYLEKYNAEESGKIRYLDYRVNESSLLSAPVIQGRSLEVLLDEKPIRKISRLEVVLHNFSDKDYEEVPVYIELLPKDGENFSLVATDAVGAGAIPEVIESITVAAPNKSNSYRAGYKIKTVNRNTNRDMHVLLVSFLVTGDIPNIKVRIDKVGLETRKYSHYSLNNKTVFDSINEWLLVAGVIIGTFIFYILLVFGILRLAKVFQRKFRMKFENWLKEKYTGEELSSKKIGDLDAEELAKRYIALGDEYQWLNTKPKFLRKLIGIEKPNHIQSEENNKQD